MFVMRTVEFHSYNGWQWAKDNLLKIRDLERFKSENISCNIELEKGQIILHILKYSLFLKGLPRI